MSDFFRELVIEAGLCANEWPDARVEALIQGGFAKTPRFRDLAAKVIALKRELGSQYYGEEEKPKARHLEIGPEWKPRTTVPARRFAVRPKAAPKPRRRFKRKRRTGPIEDCGLQLTVLSGDIGGPCIMIWHPDLSKIAWSSECHDAMAERKMEFKRDFGPQPAGLACYEWGLNQPTLPSLTPQRLGWRYEGHNRQKTQ